MTDIVLVTALDTVRRIVVNHEPLAPAELSLQLRALQRRGLSKMDLVVHLERLRAENDATQENDQVEENALYALELVEGDSHLGLSWDSHQTAAAWVPIALQKREFDEASPYALGGNDLLPSRPHFTNDELRTGLVENFWHQLVSRQYEPTSADFFRAPKTGLTTRPAALLTPQDRVVLEALAEPVAAATTPQLPNHVMWPRGRSERDPRANFAGAPTTWDVEFVVRTDITNFYESIDHAYLSVTLGRVAGLRGSLPVALEAFLDAVMRSPVGLPQGPAGSDVLASAYLLDIDHELVSRGWPLARYSDDILLGANSFEEARSRLRDLEGLLRDHGLSLANEKTRIFRKATYVKNLGVDEAPDSMRERLKRDVANWFEVSSSDVDYDRAVEMLNLPEETQWDLLYHGSLSWEDVLAEVDDQLLKPWIRAYERIFRAEADRLARQGFSDAKDALTVVELRKCLAFMSADAQGFDLSNLNPVIDWHPTLVREISEYLRAAAASSAEAVADFLSLRLARKRDSDVEAAWLISPAVTDPQLTGLLTQDLSSVANDLSRPLARATAFRALENLHPFSSALRSAILASFSPALRAEIALSLDWGNVDTDSYLAAIDPRERPALGS